MNVVWSATSPETGRFSAAVMRSDLTELEGRFAALRSRGEGYLEVELPTGDSPQVSVSFRGDGAVVQQISDLEAPVSSLLVGDGSVPPEARIEVPVMDELADFTGDFVMNVDRAWAAVRDFVRTGSAAGLGEWYEL